MYGAKVNNNCIKKGTENHLNTYGFLSPSKIYPKTESMNDFLSALFGSFWGSETKTIIFQINSVNVLFLTL